MSAISGYEDFVQPISTNIDDHLPDKRTSNEYSDPRPTMSSSPKSSYLRHPAERQNAAPEIFSQAQAGPSGRVAQPLYSNIQGLHSQFAQAQIPIPLEGRVIYQSRMTNLSDLAARHQTDQDGRDDGSNSSSHSWHAHEAVLKNQIQEQKHVFQAALQERNLIAHRLSAAKIRTRELEQAVSTITMERDRIQSDKDKTDKYESKLFEDAHAYALKYEKKFDAEMYERTHKMREQMIAHNASELADLRAQLDAKDKSLILAQSDLQRMGTECDQLQAELESYPSVPPPEQLKRLHSGKLMKCKQVSPKNARN